MEASTHAVRSHFFSRVKIVAHVVHTRLEMTSAPLSQVMWLGARWKKGSWFNDDTAGEDGSESQDSEYDDTFKKSKVSLLNGYFLAFPSAFFRIV